MASFLVLLVAYLTATNIIEAHPMNNNTDTNSTITPDRPEPTNPTCDMIRSYMYGLLDTYHFVDSFFWHIISKIPITNISKIKYEQHMKKLNSIPMEDTSWFNVGVAMQGACPL